jgi:hypothetical protein
MVVQQLQAIQPHQIPVVLQEQYIKLDQELLA